MGSDARLITKKKRIAHKRCCKCVKHKFHLLLGTAHVVCTYLRAYSLVSYTSAEASDENIRNTTAHFIGYLNSIHEVANLMRLRCCKVEMISSARMKVMSASSLIDIEPWWSFKTLRMTRVQYPRYETRPKSESGFSGVPTCRPVLLFSALNQMFFGYLIQKRFFWRVKIYNSWGDLSDISVWKTPLLRTNVKLTKQTAIITGQQPSHQIEPNNS